MKKLLFCICLVIAIIGMLGCGKKDYINTNDDTISREKADINNLFIDTQELNSIETMRNDIKYTLDTPDQIDSLMKLLESVKFIESNADQTEEPKIESSGSDDNEFYLVFNYKDGSIRMLHFSSSTEIVNYTETSYNPDRSITCMYTTEGNVKSLISDNMKKGNRKDMNEKQ